MFYGRHIVLIKRGVIALGVGKDHRSLMDDG